MSLQVWLPLNGDSDNKGISDINAEVIGSGITYTSGKIGNAATFPNNCSSYIRMPGFKYETNFSWACWFKCIGEGSSTSQYILSEGRDYLYYGVNIWLNKAGTTLTVKIGHEGAEKKLSSSVELNKWYHVAIVFKDYTCFLYLNGIYVNQVAYDWLDYSNSDDSFIIGKMAYTYTQSNAYFPFNGQINDVRIYDHALSQKEVKEISKALILHYTLDDPYIESTTNLLGTKSENFTSWGTYGFGGKGTITIADIEPAISGQVALVSNNSGSTADSEIATVFPDSVMNKNESITVSAYVKGIGTTIGKQATIHMYNTNNINTISTGTNFILTDKWQRVSHTLTWTYDTASLAKGNMYVYCNRNDGEAFYVCNCQAEKKTYMTPYVSGTRADGAIVYDSSGYLHNGEAMNVTLGRNTARYGLCSKFDGTAYIKTVPFYYDSNIWSVSFWYYQPVNPTQYEGIFTLSKDDGADSNKKISAMPNSGRIWFKGESGNISISKLKIAEWTHLVITCDGTTVKVYENTKQIGSFNASTTMTGCYDLVIGSRANSANAATTAFPYKGNLSDFRIYATTLSDNDILELYQVSSSTDRNANLWAYEFKETMK